MLKTADYCTMENIPTDPAEKNAEGKGRHISQDCLGLPTILRKILEQFSTKELIGISLVSKLWNFEARSVMKKRGNLSANLWNGGADGDNRCQRLVAFSSDLEKMRVIPFSGIHLFVYHPSDCQLLSNEPQLHPSYKIILDRLHWKHFSVRFCDDWQRCKDCPALVLVKRILQDYCEVLEELTLGFGNEEFFRTIFDGRTLPRLRILKVEKKCFRTAREYLTNEFIKTLVSSAPNLQELHVEGDERYTENILEGSSAVLVPHGVFRPLCNQVCESLVGSLRAKTMEILVQEDRTDPELLNRFIPMVLEASRHTLKILRMDILFALPLMCYGVCLENVTTLEIHMNCFSLEALELSILELLRGLDFTRVFPKLNHVTILDNIGLDFSADVIRAFVGKGAEVLSSALPDRAVNIKLLNLDHCSSLEDYTLPLLAQLFPDVKTVHTKRQHQGASCLSLREHFPGLEEVIESKYELAF